MGAAQYSTVSGQLHLAHAPPTVLNYFFVLLQTYPLICFLSKIFS